MSQSASEGPDPTLDSLVQPAADGDLAENVDVQEVGANPDPLSLEAPLADTLEQRTDLVEVGGDAALPLEADPADVAEQAQSVALDDDQYPQQ